MTAAAAIEGVRGSPLPVALMNIVIAAADLAEARRRLHAPDSPVPPRRRAEAGRRLTPESFARVKAVLAAVDHNAEATPETIAAAFDRAAAISPEGGAALYSLGDPALLATLTAEVVAWMSALELLGQDRRIVEVGCGIGRFLTALAPHAAVVLGLDVSSGMIAEAGRRCAGMARALPVRTSGRDLACIADGRVDLLLFADSFPYLVQAGASLPERHFAEARRVLAPGGRVLILNYSYRGDPAQDASDVQALAAANGLTHMPLEPQRLTGWNPIGFLLGG